MVEKLGHVGISADKSYTTSQLYVATGEDRFPAWAPAFDQINPPNYTGFFNYAASLIP